MRPSACFLFALLAAALGSATPLARVLREENEAMLEDDETESVFAAGLPELEPDELELDLEDGDVYDDGEEIDEIEDDDLLANELDDDDDDDDDDDNPSKKENLADELSSDNTVDDEKNGMVNFHSRVNSLHGKPKELFMLARKCVFNLCAAELDACRKVPVCSDQLMNCIGECVSGRLIECLGDCMSGGSMFSEVTDCYDSKCRALVHGRTKKAGSTVNTELDSDS
eukprot:CAMPEP_0179872920 /NCGR_PEP_ID=MMETSP0982-20121206/21816_1 /TAXON_ID=483367 /ORGANISM="non described non described, Strain CCMP 2436" /LENGTH=226 /DNA_ID=CAMNT_0021764089 /DNA_START=1 /DNA_END=681 /DNA_ORIENTATION=+